MATMQFPHRLSRNGSPFIRSVSPHFVDPRLRRSVSPIRRHIPLQFIYPQPIHSRYPNTIKSHRTGDVDLSLKNLSDANINHLRNNLHIYNIIFNKIINLICKYNFNTNAEAFKNNGEYNKIKTYIDQQSLSVEDNQLCNNIIYKIFDDTNNNFLNFAKKFKRTCIFRNMNSHKNFNTNVIFEGGSMEYINLVDLFSNKSSILYCKFDGSKYNCHNSNNDDQCKFCNKWDEDNKIFKSIINDIISTKDVDKIVELIKSSFEFLPSIILSKDKYDKYNIYLEEYKKYKSEKKI